MKLMPFFLILKKYFVHLRREYDFRGRAVPLFCICQSSKIAAMNITEIRDALEGEIVARGYFFVEINVSPDNDVELTVESENGTMTLDDCVAVNGIFESKFDRDKEDYSLTVTSAGLDRPFKVLKQFQKAVGTRVEVSLKGGKKFVAELTGADSEGINVRYAAREAVEGKKKKETVVHEERIAMEMVNSVKPSISFD